MALKIVESTSRMMGLESAVIRSIETCARPRGMHFSKDRKLFYVGCADDDLIAVYDAASRAVHRRGAWRSSASGSDAWRCFHRRTRHRD